MNTENYLMQLKTGDLDNLSPDTVNSKNKMENAQQHLKTELERKENVEAVYNREKLYSVNLAIGVGALFLYIYKYRATIF